MRGKFPWGGPAFFLKLGMERCCLMPVRVWGSVGLRKSRMKDLTMHSLSRVLSQNKASPAVFLALLAGAGSSAWGVRKSLHKGWFSLPK